MNESPLNDDMKTKIALTLCEELIRLAPLIEYSRNQVRINTRHHWDKMDETFSELQFKDQQLEEHRKEYQTYTSIFKQIVSDLRPLEDYMPDLDIVNFWIPRKIVAMDS